MTPQQRALLEALQHAGGVRDAQGRIVAQGCAHNTTTALWCFHHGWIRRAENGRIELTFMGRERLKR